MMGGYRWRPALAAAALAATWCSSDAAAQGFALEDPDRTVLECLTPSRAERGNPVYPEAEYTLNRGEVVAVRLTFTAPDAPPQVELRRPTIAAPFADAVREHVARYRLPCMRPGAPMVTSQEFVFRPRDGREVTWDRLQPIQSERIKRLGDCLQTPPPGDYPRSALRDDDESRLLLHVTFHRADAEPEVKVLYAGLRPRLRQAAVDLAKSQRLTCLAPGDGPVSGVQVFEFSIIGNDRATLRDVGLAEFLKTVKGLKGQRLYFDFSAMNCPFDVEVQLLQPYARNRVGQVGQSAEGRGAFLDWLESVSLNLSTKDYSRVAGDTFRIHVPCAVVDLK